MNEREHAVLSLFYDEGHREVTPSLLAYRMRMSTGDATKLLDGMVKQDILDLNIDDEGHISYRLPPSERHRIGERRQQQQQQSSPNRPQPQQQSSPSGPSSGSSQYRQTSTGGGGQTSPRGTDATAGPGPQHSSSHSATRQGAPDGTDGSVASGFQPSSDARPYRPQNDSGPAQPQSQQPYGDWYEDQSSHGQQQPRGGPQQQQPHGRQQQAQAGLYERQQPPGQQRSNRTQTASPEGRQFSVDFEGQQYGAMPNRQALAPYQSSHPANEGRVGPRRQRIPVLAGALSLLIPGLGQFYNGEIGKGVMLLFSYMFLWVFWLFWVVHIWSIIDAYMVAEQSSQHNLPDDSNNSSGQRPRLPDASPHNHSSNAA